MKTLLIFLLYTGARVGEALWLDWQHVDLARAHVSFPKTKSGKARGVPLHPRVVAVLANLGHRDGKVFRTASGRAYEQPVRIDDTSAGSRIAKGFKGACRRAGIDNFRVHDCRHTWATWHYAANRDLAALKTLGGWKSETMVLRYAHINVEQLAHTIAALPGGQLGDKRGDSGISEEKIS
jgi:integrase